MSYDNDTCTIELFGVPPKSIYSPFKWICANYYDLDIELVQAGEKATYDALVGAQILQGFLQNLIELRLCDVDEFTEPPAHDARSWTCGDYCDCCWGLTSIG
jgi:hypothetical protein